MSRIGKNPITLPAGVEVSVEGVTVKVQGAKGTISKDISKDLSVEQQGNIINIVNNGKTKESKAMHGLYRQLINNMVIGVSEGFTKKLVFNGVGYKASMDGNNLILNLGYSHPIEVKPEDGITLSCDKTTITVAGIEKDKIGQFAAKIRRLRPVEPYHAYGIHYAGEVIRRKEINSGKK